MSKFRFRLATLLKLREAARDERRQQLAQAHQAQQTLADQHDGITSELDSLRAQYADVASPGVVHVDRLIETQRYEMVLIAQQQGIQQQSKLVDEEIDRRRSTLAEADREVKVLEKLREKQHQRHQHELSRTEAKLLDEIAGRANTGETSN